MIKGYVIVCAALLFTSCQSTEKTETVTKKFVEAVAPLYDSSLKPFYHGVASGDPLQDRVIIWTRVTPNDSLDTIAVTWEVSDTENFSSIIKRGTANTSPATDYTVKTDVDGLQPGQYYYYRFQALGRHSATGRTKTLPANGVDSVKLAVVSCSNWEFGYFNAYDRIAEKEVDAVLHLGDYIYEYAVGGYGDKTLDRKHLPAHEVVTLQDYRTRYSQYHLDEGLRHVRQRHPLITIWDDHEVANNVYSGGAQNHQPDKEGDFQSRKAAARKAYYEWLPIRESEKHYRAFSFGSLADIIMLDERLEGRTKPADSLSDPLLNNPGQSMLGPEQLAWFEARLKNAAATWKVIGNQVIFSDLDQSAVSPKRPRNLDSWDGYPGEKKKIADFITENKINDVVFLTGDTHASWAFEVVASDARQKRSPAIAVEFGTTSVSSSNWNESETDENVKAGERKFLQSNPHLKYVNQREHGYLLLTLYANKSKAEWFYVETLKQIDKNERLGHRVEVTRGSHSLR